MQEKSEITQRLDQIEASVYKRLKKEEFRKHGRTLHRFVSGDISQVINFYGESYLELYESVKHILDIHPLCKLSHTKQIA